MSLTKEQYKGIFTIPVTPFKESGDVDVASLRRCIEFSVECGAHGLVGPVNASQFTALTDAERDLFVRTMVEVVDHAVPVMAGVTGVSSRHAVQLALRAQEAGCDALIAMPPHYRGASTDECIEFFGQLSQAVELPIVLQNYAGPGGTRMSAKTVARIVREIEHVDYVKEETAPPGPVITETIRLLKNESKFKGIMGGQGCAYLLTEHRRGTCGNMPACHVTDALVHLWNVIETVSEEEAHAMFIRFLPLFSIERQYPGTTYKAALHKRGVIDSVYDRAPRRPGLDSYELYELDKAMRGIEDLLTCTKYPWQG